MRRLGLAYPVAIGVVIGAFASYDLANADSPKAKDGTVKDAVELVRERLPEGLDVLGVTSLVGSEGGIVRFGGHTLELPPGALRQPTLVTLRMVPEGHVEIEATALASGMFGRIVNVGERGLAEPARLHLSYARAVRPPDDPARFVIMRRLGRDGPYEPVPSDVDPIRRVVTAELHRLAGYVLAVD
jgi:hypothetical protein